MGLVHQGQDDTQRIFTNRLKTCPDHPISLVLNMFWFLAVVSALVISAKEIVFNPSPVIALGTSTPIRFSINLAANYLAGDLTLTSDDFEFSACKLTYTNTNAQQPQYVKAYFKSQQRKLQYEIKAYLMTPNQCKQPETLIVKLITPKPLLCVLWADPHVQPILEQNAQLPPIQPYVESGVTPSSTSSHYWFSVFHDQPNHDKTFVVYETDKILIQTRGRILSGWRGAEPPGYWLTEVYACYEKTCFTYSIMTITKRIEQYHPPGGAPAGFTLKWEDRIIQMPNFNEKGANAKDGADPNTPESALEKLNGGAFTLVFPDKTELMVWSKFNHKIIQMLEIRRPAQFGYDNVHRGICTIVRTDAPGQPGDIKAEYVFGNDDISVAKGNVNRINVPGTKQSCPVPQQPACVSSKPPAPSTSKPPVPPASSTPVPPKTTSKPPNPPSSSSKPVPPKSSSKPVPPKSSTPGSRSSSSRPYPPPTGTSTQPYVPPTNTPPTSSTIDNPYKPSSSQPYVPPTDTPSTSSTIDNPYQPSTSTPCPEETSPVPVPTDDPEPSETPCSEAPQPSETPCTETDPSPTSAGPEPTPCDAEKNDYTFEDPNSRWNSPNAHYDDKKEDKKEDDSDSGTTSFNSGASENIASVSSVFALAIAFVI